MPSPRRLPLAAICAVFAPLLAACAATPMTTPSAAPTTAAATTGAPNAGAPTAAHGAWYTDVQAMADAGDNAARRAHLRARLAAAGMPVEAQAFVSGTLRGENLLADAGGPAAAPLLLIGAHSDRVDVGRGATDNASGSATVLALAERFQRRPLAHHRVKAAFWDLEERGLLGAAAYVAAGGAPGREKPALYVNVDVFGWGDGLWMMTGDPAHPLVAASDAAARARGLTLTAGDKYPPSDHLAFLREGWPAVSYSLVGHAEIPDILEVFQGRKPARTPKVMAVIHSAEDTLAHVDEAAVDKGVDAIEAAIRAWDAGAR